MGSLRSIAIFILVISFFTFVAFFGRLPALRNTPIGALHRTIWIHIPGGLRALDQRVTGGRLSTGSTKLAHVLWYDRHPVVIIFFMLLLGVSEILFLPPAWSLLTTQRKVTAVTILSLPYIFLYLAAASDPGYITPTNHSHQMTLYPYDFTIFHPGQECHTCHLLKPARSKHCSICKRCIAKLDHHCIFINNCVGYNNQHYFLLLLFFTATLTTYATYIGMSLLTDKILIEVPSFTLRGTGFNWSQYFTIWAWTLQENTRIGAVTLLCLLTTPLIWGLLTYHLYLIYAGTTTNESLKWSDWSVDMSEGYVFKRSLPQNRHKDERIESAWTRWPMEAKQVVLRTQDSLPPRGRAAERLGTGDWVRVWGLRDVENLYDLGFWWNLRDVFWPRYGFRRRASDFEDMVDEEEETRGRRLVAYTDVGV